MPDRGTVIRVLPGNRAVIMSSRCEFKEIRVGRGVKPGDEVVYSPEDVCGRHRHLRVAAMVASFLLFCLITLSAFQQVASARVYARIAFQINPGLEIGLDRRLRVKDVAAFDDRGESLIKGSEIVGSDLDEAVSEIVRLCLRRGYLDRMTPNYMAVSFYFPGGEDDRGLLQRVDHRLEAELEDNGIETYIYYLRVDRSAWKQAQRTGVSPISYILWKQAKSQGKSYDLRSAVSLRDPGVKELASRLAIRIGHSLRKQGEAGGASGVPDRGQGDKSLTGVKNKEKGVNPRLRPPDVTETPEDKTSMPPATQNNPLGQRGVGGGEIKNTSGGNGETGTGARVQGSTGSAGGYNSSVSGVPGNAPTAVQPDGTGLRGNRTGGNGHSGR